MGWGIGAWGGVGVGVGVGDIIKTAVIFRNHAVPWTFHHLTPTNPKTNQHMQNYNCLIWLPAAAFF